MKISPTIVVCVLLIAVCAFLIFKYEWGGKNWSDDAVKFRFVDSPEVNKVVSLSQNWAVEDANWYYNVSQGSHLLPYEWFLHLEQAGSQELFRDSKNMRKLGFLPRRSGGGNPDGLPIGFAKDFDKTNKRSWVGLNCSACHTSQINYKNVGYLVDGAAGLIDLSGFLRTLVAALEETSSDEQKFERFAGNVLEGTPSDSQKTELKEQFDTILDVRKGYNERNIIHDHDYARIDAFGAILNEAMSRFLEIKTNVKPANGPVSIPFVWDAPQHDKVQWNGSASNSGLGPLGRNTGEVLGVFGNFGKDGIPEDPSILPGYPSTVQFINLVKIEDSITTLWSPLWPEDFPKIDQEMAAKGEAVFTPYCARCHKYPFDRTNPNRKIKAMMDPSGTDPTMFTNFRNRTGLTGRLDGRSKTPLGEKFGAEASGEDILVHEVAYAIFGSYKKAPEDELTDIMIPKTAAGALDTPEPKYKGRPLNGIWATAPYLHNGSVPNLYQLLLPADERVKKFWVGSHEFDPVNVGFDTTKGGSEFDTSNVPNLNTGHEYGTGVSEDDGGDGKPALTDEQRKQLVEFMKTL